MAPASHYPQGFSEGVTIRELPILQLHSKNILWVDSNGGGGGKGTFRNPCLTLAAALDLCTASRGDIIVLKAGHAEAPTATIDLDVVGVSIIGLGVGRNRPTFTPAHTVASDYTFDVAADDILLKNIIVAAGTNSGGNSTQINIGEDDFTMEDCLIEMGDVNLIGVNIESNCDRPSIIRCVFRGTAPNPDVAIDVGSGSGDVEDFTVIGCHFNFDGSSGLDLAGIRINKICTGVLIKDCTMIGMDATGIDCNSNATGLVANVYVDSNSATVNEMIDAGTLSFVDTKVAYNSVSGATMPATTATP